METIPISDSHPVSYNPGYSISVYVHNTPEGKKAQYFINYPNEETGIEYSKDQFIDEINKIISNNENKKQIDTTLSKVENELSDSNRKLSILNNQLDKVKEKYADIKNYLGVIPTSTDGVGAFLWQIHYLSVSPYQIKDPSKFSMEKITSYADQKANLNKQITDANNAYTQLQNDIKTKSDAVKQAQDKLNVATINAKNFAKNLTNSQKGLQNAKNVLNQLLQAQNYYEAQIPKTQADVQAKQKVYDTLTASNKQKAENYNNAVKKQNDAYQAVKKAEQALTNANNQLAAAKKAQQDLAKDIQNKQADLDNAKKDLASASTRLSDLKNAASNLESAKQATQKASDDYKTAQKNVNDNQTQLKTLEVAKNKANSNVAVANKTLKTAQAAYDKAKAKLADAEQQLYDIEHPYVPVVDNTTNVGKEEAMTGVAHVPSPSDMDGAELQLVDGQGKATGNYIPTNSNWKVFAKKTINGQTYYRLGTDKQWIAAKYVSSVTPAAEHDVSSEEPMNGTVHVPVINNNANYKVALRGSQGHVTGNYISTNSNWKVFAKKTVNGSTYYRIGNEDQWIPAQYASVNNGDETKINGIAHVPTIHNNRNWKVALLDGQGYVTGKYIPTNSNWKVFAKKNVNGHELVRLGTDLQWIPIEFVAWIR